MRFLQILVLTLGLVIFANAQKAVLSGVIYDDFGSVIPDARINAKEKDGNTYSTQSNESGEYHFKLNKGIYQIEVIRPPFQKFSEEGYWVAENSRIQLDVVLQCKSCDVLECPLREQETIQTTKTKLSEQILQKPLEELPKKPNKIKREK